MINSARTGAGTRTCKKKKGGLNWWRSRLREWGVDKPRFTGKAFETRKGDKLRKLDTPK